MFIFNLLFFNFLILISFCFFGDWNFGDADLSWARIEDSNNSIHSLISWLCIFLWFCSLIKLLLHFSKINFIICIVSDFWVNNYFTKSNLFLILWICSKLHFIWFSNEFCKFFIVWVKMCFVKFLLFCFIMNLKFFLLFFFLYIIEIGFIT